MMQYNIKKDWNKFLKALGEVILSVNKNNSRLKIKQIYKHLGTVKG